MLGLISLFRSGAKPGGYVWHDAVQRHALLHAQDVICHMIVRRRDQATLRLQQLLSAIDAWHEVQGGAPIATEDRFYRSVM